MSNGQPFYGKYRGIVSDNRDPLNMGRIRARIPDVLGENECGWALPSLPYAGNGVGLFLLPPLNSSVWMEFEQGNPDYPIWTGCFWAKEGDAPLTPAVPEKKLLKTDTGTSHPGRYSRLRWRFHRDDGRHEDLHRLRIHNYR